MHGKMGTVEIINSSVMHVFYAYACPVKFYVIYAINGPRHGHPFLLGNPDRVKTLT